MSKTAKKEGHKTAVIVVDIQGDFTEFKEGSLAVPGTGKDYIDEVQEAVRLLKTEGFLIFATQDWHPPGHISFHTSHEGKKPGDVVSVGGRTQIIWPAHCVQDSDNAGILLDNNLFLRLVRKGSHPLYDSYSGFRDDGDNETDLDSLLRSYGVNKIVIFGLATDYCVKYTSLDGLEKGYDLIVVEALSRGITPQTVAAAVEEMAARGALIMKKLDIEKIKAL